MGNGSLVFLCEQGSVCSWKNAFLTLKRVSQRESHQRDVHSFTERRGKDATSAVSSPHGVPHLLTRVTVPENYGNLL